MLGQCEGIMILARPILEKIQSPMSSSRPQNPNSPLLFQMSLANVLFARLVP